MVVHQSLVVHDPKQSLTSDVALTLGIKGLESMLHNVVVGSTQFGGDFLYNLGRGGEGGEGVSK